MISAAAITHWRNVAPWPQDAQVEQDLILCRALIDLYQDPQIAGSLILRGGTALLKLFVKTPMRYSEDIDLVQVSPGPIGSLLDAVRSRLDPWLGEPRRERNPGTVTLRYRMESEIPPVVPMRLKIEINTREHFTGYGKLARPFQVQSPWFSGQAVVNTYQPDELLATKLRALYQRRKGRDLFDLWIGLKLPGIDEGRIVHAFQRYLAAGKVAVSRKSFEKNLAAKLESRAFESDLQPLITPAIRYQAATAARAVRKRLLSKL